MGFAEGFQMGYGAVNDAFDRAKKNAMSRGLSDIMNAKPTSGDESAQEESNSPSVIDQIKSGINSVIGDDNQSANPVQNSPSQQNAVETDPATPVGSAQPINIPPGLGALSLAQPVETAPNPVQAGVAPAIQKPAQVQQQPKVWSLLGEKFDHEPTAAEISKTRMNKAADLVAEHDPEKALQMKAQANQLELQDAQLQKARDDVAYNQDLKALWPSTNMGQKVQAYKQQQQQYQDYQAALKAGADPRTLGFPPQQPNFPTVSPDEALADHASMLALDAQHGRLDPAKFEQITQAYQNVQKEGYLKALGVANSGAPISKVAAAFNATGEQRFNPEDVVSDKMVTMPDGTESRVLALKDGSVINTGAAMKNLLSAKDQLDLALKGAKNAADITQSYASANSSNASAARSSAQTKMDLIKLPKEMEHIQAQTESLKNSGDKAPTLKDHVNFLHSQLGLDKGDMGFDPKEGEKRQQIAARGLGYAERYQKLHGKLPSMNETWAAANTPVGEKRIIGGQNAVWDGLGWKPDK